MILCLLRLIAVCLVATAAILHTKPVLAQAPPARADALEAAFIYNFAKFTDWPSGRFQSDTAPLVICAGNDSHLTAALGVLAGKLVRSHPVRIETLSSGSDALACHIIFVDNSLPPQIRQSATSSTVRGLLTVSDLPDFARAGGQIGFFYANNELRFQINLKVARRSGISFSSQLLSLADVIGEQSGLLRALAGATGSARSLSGRNERPVFASPS